VAQQLLFVMVDMYDSAQEPRMTIANWTMLYYGTEMMHQGTSHHMQNHDDKSLETTEVVFNVLDTTRDLARNQQQPPDALNENHHSSMLTWTQLQQHHHSSGTSAGTAHRPFVDSPSENVIVKIFSSPQQELEPSRDSYLYFITNACTIYRNSRNNPMALPKDKIRLTTMSQSTLNFIDATVHDEYAYILAELPVDPKVIVLRVNLMNFNTVHMIQYSLGAELSTVTWLSLVQHANQLYLAGNQISRGVEDDNGHVEADTSSVHPLLEESTTAHSPLPTHREIDPFLYSAMVNRISLPGLDNSFTFQLFDQSHEVKSIVADQLRDTILYASVLDRTNPIAAAKFYIFNFNNSDVSSTPLDIQKDPQSQFTELIYFNQTELNFTSVIVGLDDTLYVVNITYPNGADNGDLSPLMKLDKIQLFNVSSIVHLHKLPNNRLLVVARESHCRTCLRGILYEVLPEVPPSDKVLLPPWVVVVVIGFLIAVEYVCIVSLCVAGFLWNKSKAKKEQNKEFTKYESIEDEDIQPTP